MEKPKSSSDPQAYEATSMMDVEVDAGGDATIAPSSPPPIPLKNAVVTPEDPAAFAGTHLTPQPKSNTNITNYDTGSGSKSKVSAPLVLQEGTRIHHYELIRLIGRGGMGSVFLARDTKLGRRVAIKFLHTKSAELTRRFILEARTTARVAHENIVVIYEVDAWQGAPFMVFEFLQGQPLTKHIPDNKPLPPQRAVELIVPVVRALAYAHSEGIVHRDLKPDNILVTDSGTIKVLDFGIAKVLGGEEKSREAAATPEARAAAAQGGDHQQTRHGVIMGTLQFMSPEQWGIGVPIDHRSDIWAVGIMLFKMLAGKHPLDPLRGEQLMVTGMLNEPMPLLNSVAPDVPKELAAVVDGCLKKVKDQRWPDANALLRALEPFLPGRYTRELKIDESPYAGLSSFQENDADRFFGRNAEIAAMVNKVRDVPLLGVVGPSGAGKSSFVRAGLVPSLKRSGENWDTLVIRPGRNPLSALANIISPLLGTSTSVADDMKEAKALVERMRNEPGYAGAVMRSRARQQKKSILLFIDQFEELYTLVQDPKERLAFTHCLSGIADDATSPIRVVLSLRSDFLDRCAEDQQFMTELGQGLFFLPTPGTQGLRDAIIQPAEMAGYKFETTEIVEDMIRHLEATPGALPLLQFAASKLWESRDAARKMLTSGAYEGIGGIAGALASHADAVLAKIPQASQPLARAIMLRLVTPEHTRAIVSIQELRELSKDGAEAQRLVDELVQARLLVVQTGAGQGGATVEIVHESLIQSWPTLRRWLEETSDDASFLEQLRNASKQWHSKGRAADLLWRGELVEELKRFQRRYRGELPDSQQQFVDATVALESRGARRKQALVAGTVVFLSLLLIAAAGALVVVQSSRKEAVDAAIQAQLSAESAKAAEREAKEKEQERAVAAEQAEKARAEAEKARAEAEKASGELAKKAKELVVALTKAEDARVAESQAKGKALANARAAAESKLAAQEAARQLALKLAEETKRAERLSKQLGGPVIDTLK